MFIIIISRSSLKLGYVGSKTRSQGQILDKTTSCNQLSYLASIGWLVGCFGFNGPLRQYFSLYQAVSQREGERVEKG